MGESPDLYPAEALRKKLVKRGLARSEHHLESLREILLAHFKGSISDGRQDASELAEILIYLHDKKMIAFEEDTES